MNNRLEPPRMAYTEKHRPQLHFTPARNWMNDPNGMVYYDGVYHLFYQYNPADKVWDDMHWGHAISADLIHWQEKPIALHSERKDGGLGHIFSGSAVVDWNNSSGLGAHEQPPFIAIFTHSSDSGVQVQSIAYSNDLGETWEMYANNPVIDNQELPDFRDPKVFWDARTNHWVMVLAANKVIKFYRSKDLINWAFVDDFGSEFSENDGVWECPDLFPLKIQGTQDEKWVLLVSLNPGGPNGGSGTRYFIGDFDGMRFQTEQSEPLWLDYGPDNYAGVTWSDVPEHLGRRIMIAWMSNWQYSHDVPTDPWRGAMTLPRELSLIHTNLGVRLAAQPVKEVERLRQDPQMSLNEVSLDAPMLLTHDGELADLIELELAVSNRHGIDSHVRLRFFNDYGEQLTIDLNSRPKEVQLDRSHASFGCNINTDFTSTLVAPLISDHSGVYSIRLIKDASSIELVTGEGFGLFSALYFVENPLTKIEILPLQSGTVELQKVVLYELASIWQQHSLIGNEEK